MPVLPYLGVAFTPLGLDEAAAAVAERPADAPFAYVVTPNAQHVVRINRADPDLTTAYRDAWLRLCDSRVLALLARLLGGPALPAAAGSDLTARLFRSVIRPDDTVTVVGGDAEMAERLRGIYGLRALQCHFPPMGLLRDDAAMRACVDFVAAHPARFVFLAVGTPQGEAMAQRIFRHGGATGTGLCIGASLLFLTGQSRRAPLWMRRLALEWLYRLLADPRRHFRRVFVESLPLVGLVAADRLRRAFGR
ncbi:WecB/TagA/CpsF family glycosyltransferase [Oleispirillum naphthae]|uniref:WecB/TagA/CpsF family glycosyltransferase n=1 Tax=Oleispirillum naphthae TaxID=2838853 RepID=UPI00308242C0